MQAVPEKDRASESLINLESDLPGVYPITKALGLKWETISDSFIFMNDTNPLKSSSETLYTKREVASLAAKVFDPIGLIAPFTVRSKLMLQRLWTQGVGWDDVIPVETSVKWIQWVQELSELKQLHIPRCCVDLSTVSTLRWSYTHLEMRPKLLMPLPFTSELFLKKAEHPPVL